MSSSFFLLTFCPPLSLSPFDVIFHPFSLSFSFPLCFPFSLSPFALLFLSLTLYPPLSLSPFDFIFHPLSSSLSPSPFVLLFISFTLCPPLFLFPHRLLPLKPLSSFFFHPISSFSCSLCPLFSFTLYLLSLALFVLFFLSPFIFFLLLSLSSHPSVPNFFYIPFCHQTYVFQTVNLIYVPTKHEGSDSVLDSCVAVLFYFELSLQAPHPTTASQLFLCPAGVVGTGRWVLGVMGVNQSCYRLH